MAEKTQMEELYPAQGDLMPIFGLKCVLLVLQGIDASLVQSVASVLTIPALHLSDLGPTKLAKIQTGITWDQAGLLSWLKKKLGNLFDAP